MSNTTCSDPENWRRTSLPHISLWMKNWWWSTSPWLPACYWIEAESKRWDIHIHYQLCVHGGERIITGHPMDEYYHESRTVFQFHGRHFHGCPECFPERGTFFPGKGKERDQGGRVPKNVSKKQSDCPSRVQPDCEVGAREAYSNVLPTCPQEKRDVSTRHRVRLWVVPRPQTKGVAHRQFGFRELARPCLGLWPTHTIENQSTSPTKTRKSCWGGSGKWCRKEETFRESGWDRNTYQNILSGWRKHRGQPSETGLTKSWC